VCVYVCVCVRVCVRVYVRVCVITLQAPNHLYVYAYICGRICVYDSFCKLRIYTIIYRCV